MSAPQKISTSGRNHCELLRLLFLHEVGSLEHIQTDAFSFTCGRIIYFSLTNALAPPPPPTTPTHAARPTPAHLVLAAHAMVFGFVSATAKMLSGDGKGWQQDFQSDSTDAATTVTPVGGCVLRSAFSHTS